MRTLSRRLPGSCVRGGLFCQLAILSCFLVNAMLTPAQTGPPRNQSIDGAERSRVIGAALKNLNDYYVDQHLAQKMSDAIQSNDKRGNYDAVTEPSAFADRLTTDLQAISHDRHLRVRYSASKLPPDGQVPTQEQAAEFRKSLERTNCAFERAEVLPHNIGYVKFNAFPDPKICGPTVVAAMSFLAHVDAIIFDLRENGGGDPKMVAFVSSYLFDRPTHLNDLYNRRDDFTSQYWTVPFVPGPTLADKPAFVLTSRRTFSAAEEFAYDLKSLKRAIIVGEITGGGAHPVMGRRIDDHFIIGIPFAHAVNPITKTDWEGVGVQPDVAVSGADALTKAEQLAEAKLPLQK